MEFASVVDRVDDPFALDEQRKSQSERIGKSSPKTAERASAAIASRFNGEVDERGHEVLRNLAGLEYHSEPIGTDPWRWNGDQRMTNASSPACAIS
ncbi:hypothetical protein [Bradyrhizobium sp. USDA 4350]